MSGKYEARTQNILRTMPSNNAGTNHTQLKDTLRNNAGIQVYLQRTHSVQPRRNSNTSETSRRSAEDYQPHCPLAPRLQ
jgi:hypothetical protein